ncbi:MAG: transketolase, partial [Deltaproteobacteria bacterium]|nr:transketolase [Deltaproteobacteria bacterium]
VVDVNRLGQSQETMYGHDVEAYAKRLRAFDWEVVVVDGHSIPEILKAYEKLLNSHNDQPKAIVARTLKGKGVSFVEDGPGWHGKALSKPDLEKALKELGPVDFSLVGKVRKPEQKSPVRVDSKKAARPQYEKGALVATRQAYGQALARLIDEYPEVVAVDADCKNSTFSELVKKKDPNRFFEMFIAEQNMIGVAIGLSKRGKVAFASSFACFLTRAYDQVRMAAVSQANLRCVGSHAGVAIGEDGPSQMGLEDLAMFRAVSGSTVLYPSDAVSTEQLVEEMIKRPGIVYMRTNRPATPVLYDLNEKFPIGGSKVLKSSPADKVTVVGAGVTLNEALKAYDILAKEGVPVRVIDCYSVKPIDEATLRKAAKETKALVVVEDHWFEGGLGDAVLNVFAEKPSVPIVKMAITQLSRSGKPAELMDAHGISAAHIVRKVKELV